MNWATHHANSEHLGGLALCAVQCRDFDAAWKWYEQAAQEETLALGLLKDGPPEVRGVTAVRAANLWLNAGRPDRANDVAVQAEQGGPLPAFSATQLHQLLTDHSVLLTARPDLAAAVAASPPQLTPLTPNSNSTAVANGDPNNSVLVQFLSPPNGVAWWTAMTSAALQPTVLNSDQGNNVVTFKQGLTVSYHPSAGNNYLVLMSGMIVDSGTDYAFTGAILYTTTVA